MRQNFSAAGDGDFVVADAADLAIDTRLLF